MTKRTLSNKTRSSILKLSGLYISKNFILLGIYEILLDYQKNGSKDPPILYLSFVSYFGKEKLNKKCNKFRQKFHIALCAYADYTEQQKH